MSLPPFKKAVADKLKVVFPADDLTRAVMSAIKGSLNDFVTNKRASVLSVQKKGYQNRYRVPLAERDGLTVRGQ